MRDSKDRQEEGVEGRTGGRTKGRTAPWGYVVHVQQSRLFTVLCDASGN